MNDENRVLHRCSFGFGNVGKTFVGKSFGNEYSLFLSLEGATQRWRRCYFLPLISPSTQTNLNKAAPASCQVYVQVFTCSVAISIDHVAYFLSSLLPESNEFFEFVIIRSSAPLPPSIQQPTWRCTIPSSSPFWWLRWPFLWPSSCHFLTLLRERCSTSSQKVW